MTRGTEIQGRSSGGSSSSSNGAAGGRTPSEMMRDYLAREPTVTERIVHGQTMPQRPGQEQFMRKAVQVADLVRRTKGGGSGAER